MRESEVERYLRLQVKERLGGWCLKWVSPGQAGVPDRICLLPGGRLVFVETKAPGKKVRGLQAWVMDKLRRLGFEAQVIDCKLGVDAFVATELIRRSRRHENL